MWLISIGFFSISFWDILDILIVGYLLFQVYKLLRGSLGFSVFLGLLAVYSIWWIVAALEMPMLSSILGQFISVGMIALLIVFQPEARRFLILLGQSSYQVQRFRFLERIFKPEFSEGDARKEESIQELLKALDWLSRHKTGALILLSPTKRLEGLYSSGVAVQGELSSGLLISIFLKDSPLHDGAVIVSGGKILMASCVLPVSDSAHIPQNLGLRHRAAVGISELAPVLALVVSEETGKISYAREGKVFHDLSKERMQQVLRAWKNLK